MIEIREISLRHELPIVNDWKARDNFTKLYVQCPKCKTRTKTKRDILRCSNCSFVYVSKENQVPKFRIHAICLKNIDELRNKGTGAYIIVNRNGWFFQHIDDRTSYVIMLKENGFYHWYRVNRDNQYLIS